MKRTAHMVMFWGCQDVFSNWHLLAFTYNGVHYNCSEQYMMHQKALLFGDTEMATRIMEAASPRYQKALGRKVRGYVDEVWMAKCMDIMFDGLKAKFEQNPAALRTLLDTNNLEIVEASPVDRIWGVGLAQDDLRILNKETWQGKNLLGIVLMRVREALRSLAQPQLAI